MFNKIDLIKHEAGVSHDQYGRITDVYASAANKDGLDFLKKAISQQKILRTSRYSLAKNSGSSGLVFEKDNEVLSENYSPKRESLF